MVLIDTQLTAGQVLHAFDRDAPYLFLGAAFITVGFVSIAYCALRRRFDALLVWMAIFAGLYGVRLWLQAHIIGIDLASVFLIGRLRESISYLVPVPAFMFFREAGFLGHGRKITAVAFTINAIFLGIFIAAMLVGPLPVFDRINEVVVVIALCILLFRSFGSKATQDRDFAVVRIGVLCFVGLALAENINVSWLPHHVEPYGFAVLLGCLGYVAARRTLERDTQLGDIQQELDLARRIQLSILPSAFPPSANFRVAARYVPMTSVAGDLYDFLASGDMQTTLLISDVSGHGVPAALIASMVKMAAISQRALASHPCQLLAGMNTALCGNTQGQYVTAACVHFDGETRSLRYSAAGHPAMLMLRNGAVTEVSENGLLLAATELATYSEITLQLQPGDRFLLYTDGLVEARNVEGKLFGEDALSAALLATATLAPDQAADHLIAATEHWAKSQDDDLTVLVCDYLGAR
ncbi:MAG: PP2C family protein-serine/threonine phosphatase [Terracidiphilus sp.]